LAALAVRIYRLFAELRSERHGDAFALPDAAIAQAILTALHESGTAGRG
jgi:hypothetical protein